MRGGGGGATRIVVTNAGVQTAATHQGAPDAAGDSFLAKSSTGPASQTGFQDWHKGNVVHDAFPPGKEGPSQGLSIVPSCGVLRTSFQ